MDISDHPELIELHLQNIRIATTEATKALAANELTIIPRLVTALILNAQKIEMLTAQMIGEQSKRKEPPPCSQPLEKSLLLES